MSRAYRRAHREMRKYLRQFPDATAEEIAALRQWVKDKEMETYRFEWPAKLVETKFAYGGIH